MSTSNRYLLLEEIVTPTRRFAPGLDAETGKPVTVTAEDLAGPVPLQRWIDLKKIALVPEEKPEPKQEPKPDSTRFSRQK